MSSYTRLSALVWEWDRLTCLDFATRAFWVMLYTCAPAKKSVPGLWHGSVAAMADAARIGVDEATRYVETLIERDLVEYDPRHRVVRLTELPDAGEWPSNPAILLSWWKRFHDIPECGVRDAHVATIRWILDRGAREAAKNALGKPSVKHEEVWAQTFGTVPIPSPRRRGARNLAEFYNDTSTEVQPSLFAPPKASGDPLRPAVNPQKPAGDARSVDSPNLLKEKTPETLSRGSGEGEGEGEGAVSDLSSLGGIGGLSTGGGKPHLMLVPAPGAFTAAALHQVLRPTGPRWPGSLSESDQHALAHAIGELGTMFDGAAVLELLREHVSCGGLGGISIGEVCRPGALSAAIQQAQERKRSALERSAMLASVLEG